MDYYQRGRRDALLEAAAGMEHRWGVPNLYRDDAVQWLRGLADGKPSWAMEKAQRLAETSHSSPLSNLESADPVSEYRQGD